MVVVLYKWLMVAYAMAFPSPASALHPLYISVTEMNYNQADKNLEISCRIFTEDLEAALGKMYQTRTDLSSPKDKGAAEKQVAGYLKKHLNIQVDGKPVELQFLGFEKENEAVWSYLQCSVATPPKKMDVVNNILFDSFEEQINLVHVSVKGERKSTKLVNPEARASFAW